VKSKRNRVIAAVLLGSLIGVLATGCDNSMGTPQKGEPPPPGSNRPRKGPDPEGVIPGNTVKK